MTGEQPRVWSVATPVARTSHECVECREEIAQGEQYERFSGNWGGEWSTFKTCPRCVEAREALRSRVMRDPYSHPTEDMPAFGFLHEWLEEERIDGPREAP